jgi:tRNA A-37 threonylcarbamoyl transferase component Bud32
MFTGTQRFRILETLGKGGMGVIYRARDAEMQRDVALKTLRRLNPDDVFRLKEEFRAVAGIAHPNLVELHELFVEDGQAYFTMEVVEGVGLLDWLWADDQGGPGLSAGGLARLAAVLPQLVEGLSAVHAAGRLHRDVKPSNIMVTWDGTAVLLDFSLALTLGVDQGLDDAADGTGGTRPYMSPEQAQGLPLGPPSDWYALGVVLYEALTGRLPFPLPRAEALVHQQAGRFDRPCVLHPETPPHLDALVCALLHPDPARRPTGPDLLAALGSASGLPRVVRAPHPVDAPFVGRAAELDALRAALAASAEGLSIAMVWGRSGIGKSELVRRFLAEVEADPATVVLRGRCRPQEWLPFRAFDGVVDALRAVLVRHPAWCEGVDDDAMAALSRLFPVLTRVAAGARGEGAVGHAPVDPRTLRDRGFEALRALLSQLARRGRLVLWVDDAQWADADSVALAQALLGGPDAPRALLVATWQSEAGDEAPMVASLRALAGSLPEPRATEIALQPLGATEALSLARTLLGADAAGRAADLAAESDGSPFFVVELARWAQAAQHPSPHGLGELLGLRLASLSAPERTLLTLAALAGRPLERDLLLAASGLGATGRREVSRLVAMQVLRMGRVDGLPAVEPRHDRFRAAALAECAEPARAAGHLALAEALLARGHEAADPDALVTHLLAAGQPHRAAGYALVAADRAAEGLAFDRAAALYRAALAADHPDTARWEVLRRLAEALVAAGRGAEAAEALMAAAEARAETPQEGPWPAVDLRRMAAAQFACSGRYAEGLRVMREVLTTLGVSLPGSPRLATAEGVLGRLGLAARRSVRRSSGARAAADLQRLDALWSAVVSYSMVQPSLADALGVRHLAACLDHGDRSRVVRALGYEATCRASVGTELFRQSARSLLAEAESEAARTGVAYDRAWVRMARGAIAWFESLWPQSFAACDEALRDYRERCRGVAWEVATTEIYALSSLALMGRLAELGQRLPRTLRDAEARADHFAADGYVLGQQAVHWLALDQVDAWRVRAARAAAGWAPGSWHLQRYQYLVASLQALLYEGRGAEACALAEREWPALERAQLLRLESPRIELSQLRARAALAALPGCSSAAERARLRARCAEDAAWIARSRLAWAAPLAAMLRGALAVEQGDAERGARLWAAASRGFDAASMGLYATVTRAALGRLRGGVAGRSLCDDAARWMEAEGVRRPSALGWCILPVGVLDPHADDAGLAARAAPAVAG